MHASSVADIPIALEVLGSPFVGGCLAGAIVLKQHDRTMLDMVLGVPSNCGGGRDRGRAQNRALRPKGLKICGS